MPEKLGLKVRATSQNQKKGSRKITHKIPENNSGFHVKQHTKGEV